MTAQIFTELSDTQLDAISGGCHEHRHHRHHGGGLHGQLRGLLRSLGRISNSNISIVIIANSTINAPVAISVNQGIA